MSFPKIFSKNSEVSTFGAFCLRVLGCLAGFPEFCSSPLTLVPLYKALPRCIKGVPPLLGTNLVQLWVLPSGLKCRRFFCKDLPK